MSEKSISFRTFLENHTGHDPMVWIRSFLDGLNVTALNVYADWLEERGETSHSELLRGIFANWRNPAQKTGPWQGPLVHLFYDTYGMNGWKKFYQSSYQFHENIRGSWLITPQDPERHRSMARHIIEPDATSYRYALTNGKWFVYTHQIGRGLASVVSSRHVPTEQSEQYYPSHRVSVKDYRPVDISQVPDDVLRFVYYKILERQVRGSH